MIGRISRTVRAWGRKSAGRKLQTACSRVSLRPCDPARAELLEERRLLSSSSAIDVQFGITNGPHQTGAAVVGNAADQWNFVGSPETQSGGASGNGIALTDVKGNSTGATLSYATTGVFEIASGPFSSTPYQNLMNQYLIEYNTGTVTFTGLPSSTPYAVYLYAEANANQRQTQLTVGGQTQPVTANTNTFSFALGLNYVEMLGVTNAQGQLTISVAAGIKAPEDVQAEGDLNGIQLVPLNVIYVDQNATGANDGADWPDAYTNLQSALTQASTLATAGNPITIDVAQGTYSPGSAATSTFQLLNNVSIVGGFKSGGSVASDPTQYPTILSGSGANVSVVTGTGTNSTAALNGVTIENIESNPTGNGGGMFIGAGASPVIQNCTFTECYALMGGGIYNLGSPALSNCTFTENGSAFSVINYGGGMYNAGSAAPILTNCSFISNNSAIDGGGAIADFNSASVTLINCSLDSSFTGDSPHGIGGDGSAIYVNASGTLSVTASSFNNNDNNGDGGAVYLATGSSTFTNCVFYDNSTGSGEGGAVYTLDNSNPISFVNCLFTANNCSLGQAVFIYQGSPQFINCTFTGNDYPFFGETGAAVLVNSGSPTFANCILYGDSVEFSGQQVAVSYSDVEDGHNGTGNINADPMFVGAQNPILTGNSPAINAGLNSFVPGNDTSDLAGNPRIVGGVVDQGAYEFQGVNSAPTFVSSTAALFAANTTNSFTISTNGFPPATIQESGALPPGISLTDIGGGQATLSGTTTSGLGVYDLTLIADNGNSPAGTQSFVLTVGTPAVITSADNGTFTAGQSATFTVTASGTPYPALTEIGNLPTGLVFTDNGNGTATISGTPPAAFGAVDQIEIVASNGIQPVGTQTFTLTVDGPPVITSSNAFTISAGSLTYVQVTTDGPTPALSEVGALPSGMSFVDYGDGTADVEGTPAGNSVGIYTIEVVAGNSFGTATQVVTLTVTPLTVYVDQTADGDNDGTDWADAYTSLDSAFSYLLNNTGGNIPITIDVAQGTYFPETNSFFTPGIGGSLVIQGGFPSGGSTAPDPSSFQTTLSGSDTSFSVIDDQTPNLTLDGLTIYGGTATGTQYPENEGGGVFVSVVNGTLSAVNCFFSKDTATSSGGAIMDGSGALTLENCGFYSDASNSQFGGAVSTGASFNSFSSCQFTSDTADTSGGAIYSTTGLDLMDCTFASGSAFNGGAIYSLGGTIAINCTFVQNDAAEGQGGAIFVGGAANSDSLINCSLSENQAGIGGAICESGASLTVTNSILYGDGAPTDSEIYSVGATPNVTFSDVDQAGFSAIPSDIDAHPGYLDPTANLELQAGSPCIDTGSNSAVPVAVMTDLAGNTRIVNGTVDMGAYEFQNSTALTFYVDQTATGNQTGADWADAFTSLNSALANISSDVSSGTPIIIDVAAGDYAPADSIETFGISPLQIIGGFADGGSVTPNAANVTELNGSATLFNVILDESSDLTLNGLDIANGNANGTAFPQNSGAGVLVDSPSGTLTVVNCTFTNDVASNGGGAIYTGSSSVTLSVTNTTFSADSTTAAASFGGAVATFAASSTFNNCTFSGDLSAFGGGIDAQSQIAGDLSTLTLVGCGFFGDTVSENGGAVQSAYGNVVDAQNCFFEGNQALSNGGAVYLFDAKSNYLTGQGFINCLFTGNSVSDEGPSAIGVTNASPTIINCTFDSNTTFGGAAIVASQGSAVTIANSILYSDGTEITADGSSTVSASYSDVQGTFAGTGNISATPDFASPPSNLALLSNSPCVNTGSNTALPAAVLTDLAGNPRVVGGTVDMGAYEFQSAVLSAAPQITSPATATFLSTGSSTFAVMATGAPTPAFFESGTLPAGISFIDNGNGTGDFFGTPAAGTAGVYTVTIKANNGVSPHATQVLTLTIAAAAAPQITVPSITYLTTGVAVDLHFTSTGTPTPSLTLIGTLPTGLSFVDNGNGTGDILGTPATSSVGGYAFTIQASNGISPNAMATGNVQVSAPAPPQITSTSTATFTSSLNNSIQIVTTGSPFPALFEVGTLPTGVTFVDMGNGVGSLSGTPAAGTAGIYVLTIKANNGVSPRAMQTFTLTVQTGFAPQITSGNFATFTAGQTFNFQVTSTGTPTPAFFESGTLPQGITFVDNGDGTARILGSPVAGTGGGYNFTIKANNGVSPRAVQNFALTVLAGAAPQITNGSAVTFLTSQSENFTISATGTPTPALLEAGALPPGISFVDNGDGTGSLSGTPGTGSEGVYNFTIKANNGISPRAMEVFTLTLAASGSATLITSGNGTSFTTGMPGTFTITTDGPTPALSETGNLPAGVSFVDNGDGTATLAGTPIAGTAGTYALTVVASQTQSFLDETVNAMDNIYGAGYGDAPGGGNMPAGYAIPSGANEVLTFGSVTGTMILNDTTGSNVNDPDGVGAAVSSSFNTGDRSISGITAPGAGYLVGVFVGPGTPSGNAPPSLDFTSIGTNFASLSPLLNQVFYVGDGLTGDGTGAVQKFNVPSGSSQLYLGISDAPGYGGSPGSYSDNTGNYTASFQVTDTSIVPPTTQAFTLNVAASITFTNTGSGTVIASGTNTSNADSVSSANGIVTISLGGNSETFPSNSAQTVQVVLGSGNDSFMAAAGAPPLMVMGGAGQDTLMAMSDDDTLLGGSGDVDVSASTSASGDYLSGGSGNATVYGGGAGTTLNGGTGNAMLFPGHSGESVRGGPGQDTITASTDGGDTLNGGPGPDIFINGGGAGSMVEGGLGINLAEFNANDTMSGIYEVVDLPPPTDDASPATVVQTAAQVKAAATSGPNVQVGSTLKVFADNSGDSIEISASGANLIISNNGHAIATVAAAPISNIKLTAGTGNDTLKVDTDVDIAATIHGGGGNDLLIGGGGGLNGNVLMGEGGNTTLVGGNGFNLLIPGQRGVYSGSPTGNESLVGGAGYTIADFSERTDSLFLSNDGKADSGDAAEGEHVTIATNVNAIIGGAGSDTIIGTTPGMLLNGGGGSHDSIVAQGATDNVAGGAGGKNKVIVEAEPVVLNLRNGKKDSYQGITDPSIDFLTLDSGQDTLVTGLPVVV